MDPEEEPTCGKGIAASAPLPEKIAAVLRGTADVLDNHGRSLDPGDANGRAEIDAYRRLVAEHRAIADRLDALASQMRGYRDLPMASHDMAALMDQRSLDVLAALVDAQRDLSALLQQRADEYAGMLDGMAGKA